MARRRRGSAPKPRRGMAWLSSVAAYGIGLVFAAAGALVLLFGKDEPRAGEDPQGSVARVGIGLVCLGLLALGIVGYMHWLKTRR
ncbi:MAG: hypothetical protein FJ290_15780 [Planctomycetes bacterium]|nr:hypothetical protein [Planctomycetota bacterium]